jgi:energy-coupling factor transporter ATP-binding protein EcfA2
MPDHFTQIRFSNYKGFKNFKAAISGFNILVGPNNAGKSTVIGAFRLLAEGLKRAKRYHPTYIDSAIHRGFAYRVDLNEVPVSTENVFTDYDDSEPAEIEFTLATGRRLKIVFPEADSCLLIPEGTGIIRERSDFLREFDIRLNFVPVLGPVEHNERLFQQEAARLALQTRGASRNFRNIWYYYNENFDEFRDLIIRTWQGINIRAPEMTMIDGVPRLHMFCEENRVTREIYWAGFGFQVWCQMLTFIAKAETNSMLVVDEPDIYLHSDLQRQLVHILKDRDGDVLIATHSTEILAQADPADLVILDRSLKHARRITNAADLKGLFSSLGSTLNPLLTQIGKTRRVIFVEGNDFAVLTSFARKLAYTDIATQRTFAVVKAEGFRPARVRDFSDGMEMMLGTKILRAVIFDRDYRSPQAVCNLEWELRASTQLVRVHGRKELENFVLVPPALERALKIKIEDRRKRGAETIDYEDDLASILDAVCERAKNGIYSQCIARYQEDCRTFGRGIDPATAAQEALRALDTAWLTQEGRLRVVPGKEAFAALNSVLQEKYKVSLTSSAVISAMKPAEVPDEMSSLLTAIQKFGETAIQ